MAIRILILVVVLAIAGVYARVLASSRAVATGLPRLEAVPAAFPGWTSQEVPLSENAAGVLAADVTLQRYYQREDGASVWLFLAYFSDQQVNSQIHSPRQCIPGSGWNVLGVDDDTVDLAQGRSPATCMRLQRSGAPEQRMLYWFRTRSGTVTGEYALKWDLMRNALARRPTDAVFIRYLAEMQDEAAMRSLVQTLDPFVHSLLAEVGLP